MSGTERKNIRPGMNVMVVQKEDQGTGKLTGGVVLNILTNSPHHPLGIYVRLECGIVGRVIEIVE